MTTAANAPAWATAYTVAALAALPADLTTATPPQVDEAIRTLDLDKAALRARITSAIEGIRRAIGQKQIDSDEVDRVYRGHTTYVQVWPTSAADAIEAAGRLDPATPNADLYAGLRDGRETVGAVLDAYTGLRNDLSEVRSLLAPLHGEYARRPWTRYYRVNNSGGHVHTNTNCRTTYVTTPWNWPTNLSGADGAQVVEYAGALTCLVCFPDEREEILRDRPVRFDMFETPEQRDERVKREAEAKAKRDAKIAKAATVDGSVLVVQEPTWREDSTRPVELKTARAAELRYVDFKFEARPRASVSDFARGVYTASARQIAEALAAKEGTSPEAIEHRLQVKVNKRIARGY